jgi:hypothetical protein
MLISLTHATNVSVLLRVRFEFLRSVRRLLVTASVVHSTPILVTLMKEALLSSETSLLTRATRLNIPEDAILHLVTRRSVTTDWVKVGSRRY